MKPKAKGANCSECPLKDNDFVPPYGPSDASKIIVGEAPGRDEVREGRPFVGRAGKLLLAALEENDLALKDCWTTNAVLCRPPRNAKPSDEALACCSTRLYPELEALPKDADILLTGRPAAFQVLNIDKGIAGTRGRWYSYGEGRAMITWHPAYILRKPSDAPDFLRDIKKFVTGHQEILFVKDAPPEVVWLDTPEKIYSVLGERVDTEFAFDFETNQTSWVRNAALMLGIAFESFRGYVITDNMLYDSPEAIGILNEFFKRNKPIAHNGKFDTMFGRRLGIDEMWVWFDTLLGNYVLDERSTGVHGLKKLNRERFDLDDYEMPMVRKYMKSKNDDWSKIPPDVLAQYLVIDVVTTRRLKDLEMEEMIADGLYEKPFRETIMPFNGLATEMEWNGMMVDVPHLEHYQGVVEQERLHWLMEVRRIAGKPELNPNSWQQLAVVIWDERKLPQPPRRSWDKIKGQVNINPRSTSEVALFHLATVKDGEILGFEDEFLDAMFKYRRRNKILSTYINKILGGRDDNDRYHDDIKVFGTETGRFATYLHTIPRETVDIYGRMVRSAFIPAPGRVLIRADFSQAELRSAGAVSGDTFFIEVYEDPEADLHTEVCLEAFGTSWGTEQRIIVKRYHFAMIYGGNAAAMVSDKNIPIQTRRNLRDFYATRTQGLNEWKRIQQELVIKQGYIETPFGRRRRFPYINNVNYKEALKAAINVPIQSAASDITHHAGVAVQAEGYPVILTKHDEIIAEAPEEDSEWHRKQIESIMEKTGDKYLPQVKWKADASVRARWTDPPS
jgi:uracil-DNA glycosylase family 4